MFSLESSIIADKLRTQWLGKSYLFFETLDSTNDELVRMAKDGAPHGTVIVADAQTKGRGRLQRVWNSPSGKNIYMSILLRPQILPSVASLLSLTAAVGVVSGLRKVCDLSLTVKWPNDILYKGHKLSGILVEMNADQHKINYIVLGIGINVNQIDFPDELNGIATSLQLICKKELSRFDILCAVLYGLETWIDRFINEGAKPVIDKWICYADWIGKTITVKTPNGELTGKALGLESSGSLRIKDDKGVEHIILAGDVSL